MPSVDPSSQLERLRALLAELTPANRFYSRRLADAGVTPQIASLADFSARLRRLGGAVLCVVRTFLPERRQSGLRFLNFCGSASVYLLLKAKSSSQISVLA